MRKSLRTLSCLACLAAALAAQNPVSAPGEIFGEGKGVFCKELRMLSGLDSRAFQLLPEERETLGRAERGIPFLYETVINLAFIPESSSLMSLKKGGDVIGFREAYFDICRKTARIFFDSLFCEALDKKILLGCPENAGRGRLDLVLGSLGLRGNSRLARYRSLASAPPDVIEGWGFAAAKFGEAQTRVRGKGIKVAVIDTGLDSTSVWLGKAAFDRNFNFGPAGRRSAPWLGEKADDVHDPTGRGTVMAWLVSMCAPEAEIRVYKIASDSNPPYPFWSAYQLALAIGQAAADKNDIVVTGFIFDRDFEFLKKACQQAYAANIILIAPSGTFFLGTPETEASFPAHYSSVISAAAAVPDAQGNPIPWNLSAASHHLALAAPAVFWKDGLIDPSLTAAACGSLAALIAERIPRTGKDLAGQYVQRIYEVLIRSANPAVMGFKSFNPKVGYGLIDAGSAVGKTAQAYLLKMKKTEDDFNKRMKRLLKKEEEQKKKEAAGKRT